MASRDRRVDAYIGNAAPFARPILNHLRNVVHAGCPDVEETIKWSFPHFTYQGMLCSMAAFKQHCTFGFWKASLLEERGRTAKSDEAMGHFGRITSIDDLPPERTLVRLVKEAAALNEAGVAAPRSAAARKRPPLEAPADLMLLLKKNRKALAEYNAFSPSHRREYIEWITGAKREETRQRRLQAAVKQIAEGKPQNWKYMDR